MTPDAKPEIPRRRTGKLLPAVTLALTLLAVFSCRTKKETTYRWERADERRTLILRRDNSFILEIHGGYYFRVDTGTFVRKGDTLVINPGKRTAVVDSLVEMDTLDNGRRFVEVMQPVIDFGMENEIVDSYHKAVIFPSCVVNDTITLALDPDDPTYRKLHLPDTVRARSLTIRIPEERTCRPELTFRLVLPQRDPPVNSYRVYLRSNDTRPHYLAGYKWLVSGDTILTSFVDEWCTPTEVRLVRIP